MIHGFKQLDNIIIRRKRHATMLNVTGNTQQRDVNNAFLTQRKEYFAAMQIKGNQQSSTNIT